MKNAVSEIRNFLSRHRGAPKLILCLIALITVSIAADTFEKDRALRIDYSFNGATTQSRITTQVLRDLNEDVHAYVIVSAGSPDQTILSLFERYSAVTKRFTWSQESLARDPMLLTRFEGLLTDENVSSDCVVLYCAATGRARVYHEEDFPVYEYSTETGYYMITGYNYDKPFAEGILYVTQDEPITVKLLTGHNEMSGDSISVLKALLESRNYAVEALDLKTGDLADGDILMILCPKYDLTEKEYETILNYLKKGNGMVFITDYLDSQDLPYFSALQAEFGISPMRGMVIAFEEQHDAYYSDLPAYLMPRYSDADLTDPIITAGKTRLIMPGSRALKVTGSDLIQSQPVIISGHAYVRDYTFSAPDSAEKQPGDEEGYFALAAQSLRLWSVGTVSRSVFIGNSLMFTDAWLTSNTDSDTLMLRVLEYISGSAPIRLDIASKTSVRRSLDYVSPVLPVLLSLIPAAAVALTAAAVLIRRKKR